MQWRCPSVCLFVLFFFLSVSSAKKSHHEIYGCSRNFLVAFINAAYLLEQHASERQTTDQLQYAMPILQGGADEQ